ncbi:MAG: hypothetical protein HFJ06_15050 [Lachnospiraceae bacterium]|nr:hypothetical protein [Lachnospiraceae bacterium]
MIKKKKIFLIIILGIILISVFVYQYFFIKKDHIIKCPELGCDLILPKSWAGRYIYEKKENGVILVYHGLSRLEKEPGKFFCLAKTDDIKSKEELEKSDPVPEIYLGNDSKGTFYLMLVSDVQTNGFFQHDYDKMFNEIDSITIDIYEKRNME